MNDETKAWASQLSATDDLCAGLKRWTRIKPHVLARFVVHYVSGRRASDIGESSGSPLVLTTMLTFMVRLHTSTDAHACTLLCVVC
jgi:hypothetical protein